MNHRCVQFAHAPVRGTATFLFVLGLSGCGGESGVSEGSGSSRPRGSTQVGTDSGEDDSGTDLDSGEPTAEDTETASDVGACPVGSDPDGDEVCGTDDLCPGHDDRLDQDGDGTPDGCDPCVADPLDDSDGDGVCDGDDLCPGFDDFGELPAECIGCDDSDGDGVCNEDDACPEGPDSEDSDEDGIPDACDLCEGSADSDLDGVCDADDICPGNSDFQDGDDDGVPDGCDPCPASSTDDSDLDGVCDDRDLCLGFDDRADGDSDGIPDGCDPCPVSPGGDDDGDGVCDRDDLCPSGPDDQDEDSDGVPDACDPCPSSWGGDSDADGVCDVDDACPGRDDAQDLDGDGLTDPCLGAAQEYAWMPLEVTGAEELVGGAWSEELGQIVVADREAVFFGVPTGIGGLEWSRLTVPNVGELYHAIEGPTQSIVVAGRDADGYASIWTVEPGVDRTAQFTRAYLPLSDSQVTRLHYQSEDDRLYGLASGGADGNSTWLVEFVTGNTLTLVASVNSGGSCTHLAPIRADGQDAYWVECEAGMHSALFLHSSEGWEAQTRSENPSISSTLGATWHAAGNGSEALVSVGEGALYRVVRGVMEPYESSFRPGLGGVWGAVYGEDGRRALVWGRLNQGVGRIWEYRTDGALCSVGQGEGCVMTDVSIPGFDRAPWSASDFTSFREGVWRNDCDGGFLFGGTPTSRSSRALLAAFQVVGGTTCGLSTAE